MRLRWDPPDTPGPTVLQAAKFDLSQLHASDARLFERVFIQGDEIPHATVRSFRALWDLRIFVRSGFTCRSRGMITCCDSLFLLTDFPEQVARDQVFPLFGDESLLLTRLRLSRGQPNVLDLCCGAGTLAIRAARAGAAAHGIDIGKRAIAFARFNAALNEVADRTSFKIGDLFTGIRDRVIDLVVSNPPFVPHPPSVELPLFSSGGEDGLKVVGGVCSAFRESAPRAELLLLTVSLGDETESTVMRILGEVADNEGSTVEVVHVYPKARTDEVLSCFEAAPDYEPWMQGLRTKGLTWIYYHLVFVTSAPGRLESPDTIRRGIGRDVYSGSWEARRRRWRLWMDGMLAP